MVTGNRSNRSVMSSIFTALHECTTTHTVMVTRIQHHEDRNLARQRALFACGQPCFNALTRLGVPFTGSPLPSTTLSAVKNNAWAFPAPVI